MAAKPTSIEIYLDKTVKGNKFFHSVTSIDINKMELLKYAILAWEVPAHVKESDYNYLQNKVPAMDALFSDHIELSKDSIYNLCKDDRIKKLISEYVGVGVGLKYSTLLLNITPNKFKKIERAIKGKYLDYSTISAKKEYEIETKGTVSSSYATMKKDVLDKKKSQKKSKKIHLRFGTISMIKNKGGKVTTKSKCVIVDDPPSDIPVEQDDTFITQLYSYAIFLSHLLDSKYYNKYIERLRKNQITRVSIPGRKFFGQYLFEGRRYFGEFFDHRLIVKEFQSLILANKSLNDIFKAVTNKLGRKKFFIGVEESVIKAINKKDQAYLDTYRLDPRFISEEQVIRFLDKDGILIVKSSDGKDVQIDKMFPEKEVERRLGRYINYLQGHAHKCGAPCTSPGIEGKPCEKLTFRDRCYFHR